MSDVDLTRRMIGDVWFSSGARGVETMCEKMSLDRLRDVVVDTVFGMAAGEIGIPEWLRTAETVLDRRGSPET